MMLLINKQMPEKCSQCIAFDQDYEGICWCNLAHAHILDKNKKLNECPLINIPPDKMLDILHAIQFCAETYDMQMVSIRSRDNIPQKRKDEIIEFCMEKNSHYDLLERWLRLKIYQSQLQKDEDNNEI